jgi:hypothetical protein
MKFLVGIRLRRERGVHIGFQSAEIFFEDRCLEPQRVECDDLENGFSRTNLFARGFFDFNDCSRNRRDDIVIRTRGRGLERFHLILNRRELCLCREPVGVCHFILPLRVRLQLEQAFRAFRFGGRRIQANSRLDLGLRQPASFRIDAAVFDVDLRSLRGGRSLDKCCDHIAAPDALSDARQRAASDNPAYRRRDHGAFRWLCNEPSCGVNLLRQVGRRGEREFHMNQPLLLHAKLNNSISDFGLRIWDCVCIALPKSEVRIPNSEISRECDKDKYCE